MKKLQNCCNVWDANYACDSSLDEFRLCIKGKVVDIYTSGKLEGTEDDLAEIPKVLESLNEQWQESTKQGVLFSERVKKKIEGNAKVKGQRQGSRAEELPQLSRLQRQPSPAKAAPQGAAEGIGTGDEQVAAAAGIAGSRSGGGGDDGAGDGHVVADAGPGLVAQGAPASQMQQPPPPRAAADGGEKANLPAREGQVNSPAIHAGGKGKEKAAEGNVGQTQQQQPPPHYPQPQQQLQQLQPPQHLQPQPPQQPQPAAEAAAPDPAPSSEANEGDVEEELEEVADSEEEGRSSSKQRDKGGGGGGGRSSADDGQGKFPAPIHAGEKEDEVAADDVDAAAEPHSASTKLPQRGRVQGSKAAAATLRDKDVEKIKKRLIKRVSDNGLKCHIPGCDQDFLSLPNQRRHAVMIKHMKNRHPDELKPKGGMCVCVHVYLYIRIGWNGWIS